MYCKAYELAVLAHGHTLSCGGHTQASCRRNQVILHEGSYSGRLGRVKRGHLVEGEGGPFWRQGVLTRLDPIPPPQSGRLYMGHLGFVSVISLSQNRVAPQGWLVQHRVNGSLSPYSKLFHSHLLTCTGYGAGQLACIFQHRVGLVCLCHSFQWGSCVSTQLSLDQG